MKAVEIREFSIPEIQKRIEAERKTLATTKIEHVVSPVENASQIKKSRRTIARLLTILAEKQNV